MAPTRPTRVLGRPVEPAARLRLLPAACHGHSAVEITLRTNDREIGKATLRWALNSAARGPTSLSGGSLATGSSWLAADSRGLRLPATWGNLSSLLARAVRRRAFRSAAGGRRMPPTKTSGPATRERPGPWHRRGEPSTRQATYRFRRLPSSPGPSLPVSRPKGAGQSYICDWCGEMIFAGCAALGARGTHTDRWPVSSEIPHYHAGAHDDDDSCLLQALRLLDAHHATSRPVPPREQRARNEAAHREAQKLWERMPSERRETLLLHVLGDEQLIIREVTDRINREPAALKARTPGRRRRSTQAA